MPDKPAETGSTAPMLDVVVPIFNNYAVVRRCLDAVLAAPQRLAFQLVAIDDASSEPELVRHLDDLATQGRIVLVRNAENQGFVRSANRGMRLHPDRDVVLLNSDTEVANDWLDRLHACAYRADDVGTVTPFSNNATICSFPLFCADNPLPAGVSPAALDDLFARVNAGRVETIPTAVGFCMYIRRACADAVGLFDEAKFGRGYGEENDFCRRAVRAGWRNVLCADTFVYHAGSASFRSEREDLARRAETVLQALHPDYLDAVRAFVRQDPLAPLRRAVEIELARAGLPGPVPARAGGRPVQLHVVHDLGGGVARWLADYCRGDDERVNLILKPLCHGPAFGSGLMLSAGWDAPQALRVWRFATPIDATDAHHAEYRDALAEIVRDFAVDAVLVSSLIGHALDALDTGLPTVVIGHDYFPVCPAINLHFDGVCASCDDERLTACARTNPDFNPFRHFPAPQRLAVRHGFVERMAKGQALWAVPTPSVRAHLVRVAPALAAARFVTVPHGVDLDLPAVAAPDSGGRFRIVVLGMLAVSKGVRVLEAALDRLAEFADIHLVGAQEVGELFRDRPGVQVVDRYQVDALPDLVAGIRPHAGLLLSVWPETYSYTLTELARMGVPCVATRLGGFADRIIDGETGFLVDPDADAVVARLRALAQDPQGHEALARVRANLAALPRRGARAMVADYHRLLPVVAGSAAHATRPAGGRAAGSAPPAPEDAALLAAQWKDIKSLRLRLDMRQTRVERLRAADAAGRREAETLRARVAALEHALAEREHTIAALLASTSWKLSAPVRWLGRLLRGGQSQCAPHAVAPAPQPPEAEVREAEAPDWRQALLAGYQAAREEQMPALRARVAAMPERPLISVLVPTFDSDEAMLGEMLESVRAQIYPAWELCVADDGSTRPHVRALLERHAAEDARIRVDFGATNRGVSHASNRALGMARGDFVVLLDHDDMLEPQALFRVAESLCAERPDMLYSDELIVGADGRPQWFIFRPAFSLEYLRSHPYIVHLAGFRRQLLHDIGGFDETLHISQDYDLILRAVEKARRIVHIPEMLYRWRTHPASAGHRRMHEVTATSRAVLGRHLARCGAAGEVAAGRAFNFFDIRYALHTGARVAIVIPTKNHGDMARRCIESIERTAAGVAHDIVLVDHASDDPDALAYFAGIAGRVRVLRYEGPFNFSAINNWAVRQLDGGYSHYLFCNNDVEAVEPGWLERMVALGQQPGVAIVGAKLYYPDGLTLQHAGVCVGAFTVAENLGRFMPVSAQRVETGYAGSLAVNREVSAVTAACMLVRADVFAEIGGFDESIAVLFGDVDICLRAGARGYRVVLCAGAELLHHESASRGKEGDAAHAADVRRFVARWREPIEQGDPYFNPNLSLTSTTWELVQPLPFRLELRRRIYEPGADGRQRLGRSPAAE